MKNILLLILLNFSSLFLNAQRCPVGATVSSDATVCAGTNSGTLTLVQYSGYIIRWESSTDNFTTVHAIANTSNALAYSNLTAITQYRAVLQSGTCAEVYSNPAIINVDPQTIGGSVYGDGTVCANNNGGSMKLNGQIGAILGWESSTDNFSSSTVIVNTTDILTIFNLSVSTKYRAIVKSGSCTMVKSSPATITVTPTVTPAFSQIPPICSGATAPVLPTTSTNGVSGTWNPSTIDNTKNATYTFISNVGKCTTGTSLTITVNPGLTITSLPMNKTTCIGENASFTVGATGTNLNYQWQESVDGITFSNILDGRLYSNTTTPTLNVTGTFLTLNNSQYRVLLSGKCSISNVTPSSTLKVTDCSVWPGDADNNLIANIYDLIPIGLNYGNAGKARVSSGTAWQAYQANDWNALQHNGLDLKFADCDGKGTIDFNDALVIKKNYGLTHNKNEAVFQYNAANPDLYFVVPNTSLTAGTTVNAEIWAGRSNTPVSNMAGLCFKLGYDANLIEAGSTKLIFNKSWLGDLNLNAIQLDTLFENNGSIDAGFIRTDKINASGYGKIADLQMKIKTGVTNGSNLNLIFKEYKAVNMNNSPVILNPINTALITGIRAYKKSQSIAIVPNPSSGIFTIATQGLEDQGFEITITNIQGQEIYKSQHPLTEQMTIDLSGHSKGIYFLHCKQMVGYYSSKLVIQ